MLKTLLALVALSTLAVAFALPAQYEATGRAIGTAPLQRFPVTVTSPGTNYPAEYLRLRFDLDLFTYWGSDNHTAAWLYKSGHVNVHLTFYQTPTSNWPIISAWGGHLQQPFWVLIPPHSSHYGLSQGEPVTNTGTGQVCSFPHDPLEYFGGVISPLLYPQFPAGAQVTLWVEMQVVTNIWNSYDWHDFSGNPPHIPTRLHTPTAQVGLFNVRLENE